MKMFDREALSDCFDSKSLAREIHRQFGLSGEVAPLREIASSVGIWNIREEKLSSIEGALVVPAGKIEGEIILNSGQIPERKRFTLAHEIGHFVHPMHHSDDDGRFNCSKDDIFKIDGRQHLSIMEDEANEFASELLLPESYLDDLTDKRGNINFDELIPFCGQLEISKAFTLRKLQPLCKSPTAFIFSYNGIIRYTHCDNFPYLKVWSKDALPPNCISLHNGETNTVQPKSEVDFDVWLQNDPKGPLYEQLYIQENGYRITMLTIG